MKITNIKQQVKNAERISIYVDGKYSFSLSLWQLGSAGLKVGEEIEPKRLNKLKADSDFGKLYDRTLNWLFIRPRSRWELEQYLKKKTDDVEVINKIIDKVTEKK